MNRKSALFWLKCSFIIGAITDALALIPMTFPPAAKIMWGFDSFSNSYYFAMGYGSTLMLAWTILLVWASIKPGERRVVALFTDIVIVGLAATETVTALLGFVDVQKLIPTFILQFVLLALFTFSFTVSRKRKR